MRILGFSIILVAALAGGATTARAAACYTHAEAVAEQAIRIHSELMVIGLNCQHLTPAGQENLYQAYHSFTVKHRDLLEGYETTLVNYFKRSGSRNPEADINLLRTAFANKLSLDVAKMRPDLFCRHYIPRIQKATAMQRSDIQKWAATFFDSHPVARPICGG